VSQPQILGGVVSWKTPNQAHSYLKKILEKFF